MKQLASGFFSRYDYTYTVRLETWRKLLFRREVLDYSRPTQKHQKTLDQCKTEAKAFMEKNGWMLIQEKPLRWEKD